MNISKFKIILSKESALQLPLPSYASFISQTHNIPIYKIATILRKMFIRMANSQTCCKQNLGEKIERNIYLHSLFPGAFISCEIENEKPTPESAWVDLQGGSPGETKTLLSTFLNFTWKVSRGSHQNLKMPSLSAVTNGQNLLRGRQEGVGWTVQLPKNSRTSHRCDFVPPTQWWHLEIFGRLPSTIPLSIDASSAFFFF